MYKGDKDKDMSTGDREESGKVTPGASRGSTGQESQLQFLKYELGERMKLALVGELRHGNAESLYLRIQEAFDAGAKNILLDLGGVTYCDTAGLQALVKVYKYLQDKPGLVFRIFAPEGFVMETLQTCRFDKFLSITQDPKEVKGDWVSV